jgi:CheY-like chemotaxis protein
MLWEMLTGTRLFRNKDHKKTIKMIVSHSIPAPSTINPEVPPSVDRICAKALARDRTARYQTMGALLGELSRVADTLPRRAATRDLAVYMRRQFGTAGGGYTSSSRSPKGGERSSVSAHSGFGEVGKTGVSEVSGFSMTPGERVPLGQILIEQGSIGVGDLEIALAEQRARGGRIGELLVASGTISEDDLLRALSIQSGQQAISDVDLSALSPPIKLLKRFPRDAAEATLILPISINEAERSVGLAVVDPYDERAILETKVVLGVNDVVVFLAKRSALRAAISQWYAAEDEEVTGEHEPIFEPPVEMSDPGPPVVLFADADEASLREVLARVKEEECEVLVASDGKKARDILRERRPSVAFLDAALPGIDGYNLLLELRSKNDDAAVFITSSRGDDFRQAKALELGADDFVVKPFSLEITASKIRREIQKRSSGRRVLANPVKFDGVSGSLKDMTGLDIAQSLELGRKSAHVVLQYEDGRSGELAVRQGQIGGAMCGTLPGEEAFYLLMRPGVGLFRIEYRPSTCPENITKPNTYLIIEAMRRLEEEDRKSPPPQAVAIPRLQVPSADTLPDEVVPILDVTPAPIIEAPSVRTVKSPESGPANAPLSPSFAGLADDLVLEPPGPSADPPPPDRTPVGADLAGALDRLLEEHLEDKPTEVVRMTKPTVSSDYQRIDGPKTIGRMPLKRKISDEG